jgi:hypothetical protein
MNISKNRFVLFWLGSAAVVTLVRLLNAADLGYDLTLQIEAAENLLAGKGLSIYWPSEADLAKPATLLTLTHFPAGYSLCAAGLISLGLGVGAVVKTCGAVGTILGWWGWGWLAYFFFREGLQRSWSWRWAGCLIALSTPLLFTPHWQGTDIFLWAAVPWVLYWIVRASDENAPGGRWFDGLAGVVCGLCVLMRYASVFLAVYAGVLILFQSKAHLKVLARRWALFIAGLLPPVAFQAYSNFYVSNAPAHPGGLEFGSGLWAGVQRIGDGFWLLTSANFAVVYWMPHRIIELLTRPGKEAPWLLGATFIIFALAPLFAVKLKCQALKTIACDVKSATIGFFVAVPLFLWGCMLLSEYAYVTDLRYYIPLLPIAPFLAYACASAHGKQETRLRRLLRIASLGYLTGYLCLAIAGVALLVLPIEQGSGERARLMGTHDFQHWPSTKVTYEFSAARTQAMALLREQPDTILVTNRESWFYADPTLDHSRIFRIEIPGTFRPSYVSGPVRVLIVALDPLGAPVEDLHVFTAWAKPERADYLEHLPNLRLLTRFPEDNIKILESDVPAGMLVTLQKTESSPKSIKNR